MKRIFSLLTAFVLVLALGAFLPEGVLGIKADAAVSYMQILTATDGGVVSFDNENYYTSTFSSYSEGAYVTMYAAPCNGYEFKGWRKGSSSTIISTSKSIRNLCVEKTTYTAVFELKSGYLKQTITTAGRRCKDKGRIQDSIHSYI